MDCTFKLANGIEMPKFGLGTYKMSLDDGITSISEAYKLGYKLFGNDLIFIFSHFIFRYGHCLQK